MGEKEFNLAPLPDFVTLDVIKKQSRNGLEITVRPNFRSRIRKGYGSAYSVKDITFHKSAFDRIWVNTHWTLNQNELVDVVDDHGFYIANKLRAEYPEATVHYELMNSSGAGRMHAFNGFCKDYGAEQNTIVFDAKILFSNHEIVRDDYATTQLTYMPIEGNTPNFDELFGTLYEAEQLEKILWFVGAALTDNMDRVEKMLYLFGRKGTGKGTVIKLLNMIFQDYVGSISLQRLTGSSEFAGDGLGTKPILIDSDTDMRRVTNDTLLLKVVSHEEIIINRKNQQPYPYTFKGLIVAASNQEPDVRNSDAGITRRLLVARPSDKRVPGNRYTYLIDQIQHEIPFIAQLAIDTFNQLGVYRYDKDVDVKIVADQDIVFRFVRENAVLLRQGISLTEATKLFTPMIEDMGWSTQGVRGRLERELQRFYGRYHDKIRINGKTMHKYFTDFLEEQVFPEKVNEEYMASLDENPMTDVMVELDSTESLLDEMCADYPAQLTNEDGYPLHKWENVRTTLKDIDTSELHFVQLPTNHIVIDFDLKDKNGEKDLDANLIAAAKFPPTYAEVSKSGGGVHLHYIYDGEPTDLATHVDKDIEIKVYTGKMALRRKLTKCNNLEVAHISTGLPLRDKQEKSMYAELEAIVWTEEKLNNFIDKCLAKEHHGATKPEIDFIYKVLTEARDTNVQYDLRIRQPEVLKFAMASTHNAEYCMSRVADMPFSTIPSEEDLPDLSVSEERVIPDEDLWFFDIEVLSNLFVICAVRHGIRVPEWFWDAIALDESNKGWSFGGTLTEEQQEWYDDNKENFMVLFNPTPTLVKQLCLKPLIGFNNRKYDNHIVYNAMTGYTNLDLFNQSQGIIANKRDSTIVGAYNLSYADLYEFMDIKQSLKKWEIALGIQHDELEFPWDKPLAKEDWIRCAQYCMHDVHATDIVFSSKPGQDAYTARKILAELTGSSINTKTQTLAERFLFGDDPEPQKKFGWYDLSKEFPGYTFDQFAKPKSQYLGEDPSEGGYVFSKPGVYENVAILDVASLHPHSLIAMNYFGEYTEKFAKLVECRMDVKHKNLDAAAHAFDEIDPSLSEKLQSYLDNPEISSGLAHALKIVINIVYGMTSAPYDNKFKDPRNIDNCIAKRGALFMLQLKQEVIKKGYEVIHVKTDSIKIANHDQEILDYCMARAKEYGYTFEHEHTYSKLALLNKAVLYGLISWSPVEHEIGTWETVGAQVREPYVKSTLFTDDDPLEKDFFLLKSATSPIYIGDKFVGKNAEVYASHTGEDLMVSREVDIAKQIQSRWVKPVDKFLLVREREGLTGLELDEARINKISNQLEIPVDIVEHVVNNGFPETMMDKRSYVGGTKGFKWRLASDYQGMDDVDMKYYNDLVQAVIDDTYAVGDGDIIFGGTKWKPSVK